VSLDKSLLLKTITYYFVYERLFVAVSVLWHVYKFRDGRLRSHQSHCPHPQVRVSFVCG